MRDGAVGVGPFDVEAQGGAVRGVADAALQAAVGFHFGVAYLELSASRWSAVFKAFKLLPPHSIRPCGSLKWD